MQDDSVATSQIAEMLLVRLRGDVPVWMNDANCLGADNLNDPGEMKPLCDACPVSRECLDYAEEKDVRSLIWGGRDIATGEDL